MINEEEEVEIYYKVYFKIHVWDGTIKEHLADLPGNVQIKDLKEELRDELGVPMSSKWYLAKDNTLLSDEDCLYGKYNIECDDVINVVVHQTQSNVPDVRPVMEKR